MLKKFALVIAVAIVALLVFAWTKPNTFRVERTARIDAPAEKIYPFIEDFHRWGAWSPWEKLDPAMQRTFSGAPHGTGAVYAWAGNKNVGQGRMEIADAVPSSRVTINLDFLEPFESHNTTEFLLEPQGNGTKVIWAMYGPNTYMGKLMSVFASMDKMIGKDFEKGLTNLKAAAEQ